MLHLCLARNLLVAIGGGKLLTFYDKLFIPTYPSPMLHRVPPLMLGLEPCSPALMQDVFMPLEMPAKADAPAQPESYNTLGQFYAAIADGFERLSSPELWRTAHPELQYDEAYWNQDGGGAPIVVTDLPTAQEAIRTIVEQGEGAAPGDQEVPLKPADPTPGMDELSHYAKFSAIAEGIDGIGDTWPVPSNPTREQFGGPVGELATLFDAAYCYVLCLIDAIYASSSKTRTPGKRSPRYVWSARSSRRWADCCTRSATCSSASRGRSAASTQRRRSATTPSTARAVRRSNSSDCANGCSATSPVSAATTACAG